MLSPPHHHDHQPMMQHQQHQQHQQHMVMHPGMQLGMQQQHAMQHPQQHLAHLNRGPSARGGFAGPPSVLSPVGAGGGSFRGHGGQCDSSGT